MKQLPQKEAPDLLGGPAGDFNARPTDDYVAVATPIVAHNALDGKSPTFDPIVEAIRILARRGRQIREAQEAAARATTQVCPEQQLESAGVEEPANQPSSAATTVSTSSGRTPGTKIEGGSFDIGGIDD